MITNETDYLLTGPPVKRLPIVGKRRTSYRRRQAVSAAALAQSLANAAGGTPIDRHKPYVYGASSARARAQVIKAYARLLEEEGKP